MKRIDQILNNPPSSLVYSSLSLGIIELCASTELIRSKYVSKQLLKEFIYVNISHGQDYIVTCCYVDSQKNTRKYFIPNSVLFLHIWCYIYIATHNLKTLWNYEEWIILNNNQIIVGVTIQLKTGKVLIIRIGSIWFVTWHLRICDRHRECK